MSCDIFKNHSEEEIVKAAAKINGRRSRENMSKEARTALSRKAAAARWNNKKSKS